ncbi:MAG TPA: ADP-ribosylglycohydrolase family protein [Kofleriaceae bacterium]|nr:ADP-ribosylglycohydrolase family protein [Kofleriaceae bacterium]
MVQGPPLDRVLGCLLGGALGDALGYPVEFIGSHEEIARRFGAGPPARLAYAGPALVSDDTQMTMFVAEGLLRALQRERDRGFCDPHEIGLGALMRWYATQSGAPPGDAPGWLVQDERLHARRAPGTTCLSSLAWRAARHDRAAATNDSKGCGGVMRAAPFGFLASAEVAFEHAVVNARFTHGHPTGSLAAGHLAATVWHLARGAAPAAALDVADALLATREDAAETAAALEHARRAAEQPLDATAIEALGGGWIAEEALAIAVACFLAHARGGASVAGTLWIAACHGGDSDSTAAITGNLLGAALGAGALPEAWLAELELRDALERLARDLHGGLIEGRRLDRTAYPPS